LESSRLQPRVFQTRDFFFRYHKERDVSDVVQDYLKAIYKIQTGTGKVSTSALAERMGVTAPSATNMIERLADLGLLRHDRYRGAELTEAGARTALEVIRHHRLWEQFLAEALRVPLDRVHDEAERLEHTLSDDLEERIDNALGHPSFDPHGDPIPNRDGSISEGDTVSLSELTIGVEAVVRRVPDSDAALLRYLGGLGLLPGGRVRLAERAPFGGTLFVEVGDSRQALGLELARRIMVQTQPDDPAKSLKEGSERSGSGDRPSRGKAGDEAAAE
jgi:DtxR family Mn-dependent transcriptional regulator